MNKALTLPNTSLGNIRRRRYFATSNLRELSQIRNFLTTIVAVVFILFPSSARSADLLDCTKGEPNISIPACTRLLKTTTLTVEQRASLLISRSVSFYRLAKFNRALSDLNEATKLTPRDSDIYNTRGVIYYALNQDENALQDFEKSITLNPNSSWPYINRARLYARQENYARAIDDYNKAAELDRAELDIYLGRGDAHRNLGNYRDALKDYDTVIKLAPTDPRGYAERGFTNENLNNIKAARSDYQQALRLDPRHEFAKTMLELLPSDETGEPEGAAGAVDQPVEKRDTAETVPPSALRECRETSLRLLDLQIGITEDLSRKLADDPEFKAILEECKPRLTTKMEFLHGMDFVSLSKGWAVGWNGLILHTSDAGASWIAQVTPDKTNFFAVDFVDESIGWAVGANGSIFHTEDGGSTWELQARLGAWPTIGGWLDRSTLTLRTITCVGPQRCWTAGSTRNSTFIYATVDGGTNWSSQDFNATGGIQTVQFLDEKNGYAVSDQGTILGSTNGGKNWKILYQDINKHFRSLHFIDTQNGWAVGQDAIILHTNDGGRTWTDQTPNVIQPQGTKLSELRLHAVRFVNRHVGWAAGLKGVILTTRNGGVSWKIQVPQIDNTWTLYAMSAHNEKLAWVAGNAGRISATIDGGDFWFLTRGVMLDLSKAAAPIIEKLKREGTSRKQQQPAPR